MPLARSMAGDKRDQFARYRVKIRPLEGPPRRINGESDTEQKRGGQCSFLGGVEPSAGSGRPLRTK